MKLIDWLIPSMNQLKAAGVDSPRRDCMVLVEDLLEKDRSWINAHPEFLLTSEQIKKLDQLINRRINREPLAYIRGKAWFYRRFFEVNPGVMIPRPESESFIALLKYLQHHISPLSKVSPWKVIDVGTGSGCLAITAKLEISSYDVIAIDIDSSAFNVAKRNAKKYRVEIKLIEGDLLSPLDRLDVSSSKLVIMANLPYVPDNLITSKEITYEPKIALFSGVDGLNHYRKLFEQIRRLDATKKPKFILLEALQNQHSILIKLGANLGYKHVKSDNLVVALELDS